MIKVYAAGATCVYSFYVSVDLYLIAERIEIDDYILGALTLYIDLVTLFVHILQLLGKRR